MAQQLNTEKAAACRERCGEGGVKREVCRGRYEKGGGEEGGGEEGGVKRGAWGERGVQRGAWERESMIMGRVLPGRGWVGRYSWQARPAGGGPGGERKPAASDGSDFSMTTIARNGVDRSRSVRFVFAYLPTQRMAGPGSAGKACGDETAYTATKLTKWTRLSTRRRN